MTNEEIINKWLESLTFLHHKQTVHVLNYDDAFAAPEMPLVVIEHTESFFHALWREVHTKQDPVQSWFDGWLSRIPNISLGCQDWV